MKNLFLLLFLLTLTPVTFGITVVQNSTVNAADDFVGPPAPYCASKGTPNEDGDYPLDCKKALVCCLKDPVLYADTQCRTLRLECPSVWEIVFPRPRR